jgi:uroporphyrinogen-III synthase
VAQPIHAVVVTSPSSVQRLAELLGGERLAALTRSAAFVAIGATSLAAMRDLGMEPRAVAESPSTDGVLHALERVLAPASTPASAS